MVELMELPEENLQIILSKLPIKSIAACQCACKTLLHLTSPKSTPYFTTLHSQNAATPQMMNLIFQFGRDHPEKHVYLIDAQLDFTLNRPRSKLRRVIRSIFTIPKTLIKESNNKLALVNACNGFIYFAIKSPAHERCSLICNPILHRAFVVPKIIEKRTSTSSLWLGFSPNSRTYKVLRFFNYSSENGNLVGKLGGANILDVGSSSLRRVRSCRPLNCNIINWDNSYAFINGTGYWLCQNNDYQSDFIVSFDFESEKFGTIDAPPSFDEHRLRCLDLMGIGAVGDCLCLTDNTGHQHLDIWMMTMNKGTGNWIKKFTCQRKARYLCGTLLRPLVVISCGDILMVSDNRNLVFYDVKRNNFRPCKLHKLASSDFNIVTFVPSFVSFKDALSLSLSPKGN